MEDDAITWGVGGQQLARRICNCHRYLVASTPQINIPEPGTSDTNKRGKKMSLSLVLFLSSTQ